MNTYTVRISLVVTVCAVSLAVGGCATKGLVSENYHEDFYTIPKKLDEGPHGKNPRFLA